METRLISVRMPIQLISQMKTLANEQGYASLQEIIKESVRLTLEKKRIESARVKMKSLAGSQDFKVPFTKRNRAKFAREFLELKKHQK